MYLYRWPFNILPDCRLVLSLELIVHCRLDAVTVTEKLRPQLRPGTLHWLESDMHTFEMPPLVCMVAV